VDADTQNASRPDADETGRGHAPDAGAGTQHFGTGPKARIAAMQAADDLRDRGIAAAALFRPAMGGWIVRVYPGGIRRRS